MKRKGEWQSCLIDIDRATEFTGDDVDRYSKLVDLGLAADRLLLQVPTIDSAAINVYAQEDSAVATVPKPIHYVKPEAGTSGAWATSASTGALLVACDMLGGHRFVRLYSGANQTADRTVRICGVQV